MPVTTDGKREPVPVAGGPHPRCWVCSPAGGLAVDFRSETDGRVVGEFDCPEEFEGYPGLLHGGLISTLLDGAMTRCLMARGTPGLTARLEVRYLKPVLLGRRVEVTGWQVHSRGALHVLESAMTQGGEVVARARGRFMEYREPDVR